MSSFKKVSIALVALGLTVPVAAGCESSFAKASEDKPIAQTKTMVRAPISADAVTPREEGELVQAKFAETPKSEEVLFEDKPVAEDAKHQTTKRTLEFDALDELANYEPVIQEVDGIQMIRLITSAGIADREPTVLASIFPVEEEKIYAFMELANTTDEVIELDVIFAGPNGESTGYVAVEVPANTPRWRTWAYTRYANTVGQWKAEVRLKDGTLLGKLAFDVDICC